MLTLIGFMYFNSCVHVREKFIDETSVIEHKVDSLIALMTLEEKIGQMTQVRHFDLAYDGEIAERFIGSVIHTDGPLPGENAAGWQRRFTELQKQALSTRLGIPLLIAADAVHGQNTYPGATIFPHNIGLGATQNEKLVKEIAAMTAIESRATRLNWTFAPCLAIPFNERWGRVYEAFSESTDLTTRLGSAAITGLQGNLQDRNNVLATAKHYVGDGATDYGREGGNTTLPMNLISKLLLPPYHAAVKEQVGAVMLSFNSVSDITMHAHKVLITDTLKSGMEYTGIVLTDWRGYSRFGKNKIINAGVDMVMAVEGDMVMFQKGVRNGIESGEVTMERIDDAVRRILRQKYRLGLFDHPFPDSTLIDMIGSKAHRDKSRQAVRESLVLMKHENDVLPLDKRTRKIVVVGEHADNTGLQSGGWTIRWQGVHENYPDATTILDGIRKFAKGEVAYDKNASGNHPDADVAIVVVGETPYAEAAGDIVDEGGRYNLMLSPEHQRYVQTYKRKGVTLIVILVSGRPLVVGPQIDQSDAFIAAWLPGSEGDGIAEVLFGDYNFKGRLPHSWPASVADFSGKYGPNFWEERVSPLFKIGYGLVY